MLRMKACGLTDVGMARSHNEDCFGIDREHQLVVVADGMGGHSHGEVASRIAVESIHDYVGAYLQEDDGTNGFPDDHDPGEVLATAIRNAHRRVLTAIQKDGSLYGMGTTVVGFLLAGDTATVAHVGDSRAYLLKEGRLELLTQDHTWVNEQVVAGFLSEEQARLHPLKNVITRALGGENQVQVDLKHIPVAAGDQFLLCSDGLTTMLSDPEIQRRIAESPVGLEDTVRALVEETNARGGLDNVTVVLVTVEEGGSTAEVATGPGMDAEADCDPT